jgi:hypothetical protein
MSNNHERIKKITNDVYNGFYLKVKDMENTDEDWQRLIDLSNELSEKNEKDEFCKKLIMLYESEIDKELKARR